MSKVADDVVIRVSIRFPPDVYGKLDELAKKEHRSIHSLVLEACDIFVNETAVRRAAAIAESSPEYQAILGRLKKDLGFQGPHQ